MFHVKHMKNFNKFYCTAKDRLVTGHLFSIYFNQNKSIAKTKVNDNIDMFSYYKSDQYHSHQKKANYFIDKVYFICRKLMFRYKLGFINKNFSNVSVLDYGCGNGHFLSYLKKRNIKALGVEKSIESQTECKSKGLSVFSCVKSINTQKFTTITMWHVLEHVANPSKCISTLSTILVSKGTLVIAVPNIESTDSQVFKEEWAALDVPRHLWHFTPDGLIKLLNKQGFVLVKKRPLLLDAYYISLLSAKRKRMFFPWIIAFCVATLSNIIGLFNGNYSSNIFVFRKNV